MQGQKQFTDQEVTRFRLSERVPAHNFYRRLAEVIDWRFLYQETQALYSHTGQPSLDPVVFFKLVLVGKLENLVSDRRLVEHCALRLDMLYFLGYEVDEDLPLHSHSCQAAAYGDLDQHPPALFILGKHQSGRLRTWVAKGERAGRQQCVGRAKLQLVD
jgi:hypothetical protein